MIWKQIDVCDKRFMKRLWKFMNGYFAEICDKEDLKYFKGAEYHDAIIEAVKRESGCRIVPLAVFHKNIFCAVCFYSLEMDGSAFIMEFYLEKSLRGLKNGKKLYLDLESDLISKNISDVSLTPTNDSNKKFWIKMGFEPTGKLAENNKEIFFKKIGENI